MMANFLGGIQKKMAELYLGKYLRIDMLLTILQDTDIKQLIV